VFVGLYQTLFTSTELKCRRKYVPKCVCVLEASNVFHFNLRQCMFLSRKNSIDNKHTGFTGPLVNYMQSYPNSFEDSALNTRSHWLGASLHVRHALYSHSSWFSVTSRFNKGNSLKWLGNVQLDKHLRVECSTGFIL